MGEKAQSSNGVDTGGEPQTVGRCTACGNVYPVQSENGVFRPIGTDGVCECGNAEFEPPSDA